MNNEKHIKDMMNKNNDIWDGLYKKYQVGSTVPGVKYPNEHLIRFIRRTEAVTGNIPLNIIDVGFGSITNMEMMSRNGHKVRGLEVSEDVVNRARLAITERGLQDSLSVDVFSGGVLPLEDESVDVIIGLQCVYYNLDQYSFSSECARVLKPGGKILFSFFTDNSSYMNYIHGQPGSIVQFNDEHPHPRLRGLDLFLFKSKQQIIDVYGECFDVQVGLDETDLYPNFFSWYYLIGEKNNVEAKLTGYISLPASKTFENSNRERMINKKYLVKNNVLLWEKKYEHIYAEDDMPLNQFPNETFIRFLANQERGEKLNEFYTNNIGKEDDFKCKGKKLLEIMPINIVNSIMALEMGCSPYALTFSSTLNEAGNRKLKSLEYDNSIILDKYDGYSFPYDDGCFDFVISEKIGSHMPDQDSLVNEVSRVIIEGGTILIGYLSDKHSYMNWVESLGNSLYRVTIDHPDPTLHNIVIFVPEKETIRLLWEKYFDLEVKFTEYDTHRYYSSFNIVRGKRNSVRIS